jgi:hypothetical protein
MKEEITIILMSLLIVFGTGYLSFNANFTGQTIIQNPEFRINFSPYEFFMAHWSFILIIVAVVCLIIFFGYKKIKLSLTRKKIRRMSTEKKVILGLMKKTQIDRYQKNKVSELVYNIRIKKYKEKLNKISRELPVLENQLNKLLKRKIVSGNKQKSLKPKN